jgi:hypothetical protein
MTVVDVRAEERYWYPADGGIVWLAGFYVVDPDSGSFLANDAPELAARGLRVANVAGAAQFHAEALRSDAAAPGEPLTLRRDPANDYDPNAIAVDAATGEQLGFVPRELAAQLAPRLDAGEPWAAIVLRERRTSPREERNGLTMLLAADRAIELRTAV